MERAGWRGSRRKKDADGVGYGGSVRKGSRNSRV